MNKLEHWLTLGEKASICEKLLRYNLLKWDNIRQLPLKSGGKTDIYINLRNARSKPEALMFLAQTFMNPIMRLQPNRFVEIPDSVSCLAGPLSIMTNTPYITIREEAKPGRVATAKTIGDCHPGEQVVMIDDVITDGASKIIPYRECVTMGLDVLPLVVLVDRQQGWRAKFQEKNISLKVWPGMTLHDVRRYLIENGLMQRCDPAMEEKNPVIVALDGKDWDDILPLLDILRTTGCIFKVNDLLFAEGINNLVPDLQVYGRVMADIKGHDIKNTLENIAKRILPHNPWAITVHGSGGKEMIEATVKALNGSKTKVLVVTVLTSINQATCEEIYIRLPIEEVRVLARIANDAGAHGLVCSPEEVGELREKYPNMTIVTPGVRSPGADAGDQKRIGTPAAAKEAGANHLVMGRQILGAADPVGEMLRVIRDELNIQI